MQDQQMNRVQRRLWAAFLAAGGDVAEDFHVERFQRLVHDYISVMPPALSRVMMIVLSAEGEVDYERVAAEFVKREGLHLSRPALRQRLSRAIRRLEAAIHGIPWKTVQRTAVVFERRPQLRRLGRAASCSESPRPASKDPPAKTR